MMEGGGESMAGKPLQEGREVTFPKVTEQPVAWGGRRRRKQADGFKAIVDSETGKVFSIVSTDYRLIRHEQAIEEVEAAIHRTNGLGPYEVKTAFYNDGGRLRRIMPSMPTCSRIRKTFKGRRNNSLRPSTSSMNAVPMGG